MFGRCFWLRLYICILHRYTSFYMAASTKTVSYFSTWFETAIKLFATFERIFSNFGIFLFFWCLLGVILIGREKINSHTNNNEIVKSQPLNSISWLWMCVTFYAHYAFKVCAYNRFTHKWYRTQHKISHVYATERVNERRYADYRAVCLGRCCCCCCHACVCAHSRAIQSICVMVIACNYTKSHLCKYKNSSCTYAILSQIL